MLGNGISGTIGPPACNADTMVLDTTSKLIRAGTTVDVFAGQVAGTII